jgi:hypothetical protein
VVSRVWLTTALVALIVLTAACRGGAAARAASLPQPTEPAQWLALAVFIFGGLWLLLKIARG